MGWERTEPSKVSVLVMLVDGGDGCSPLMSAAKCRGSGATDLYNIFSGEDPNLSFTFEAKVTIGVAASSSSSAQSAHDLLVSMPKRARMLCCHLWARGVLVCSGDSLGGVLARAIRRVRADDAGGTHSFVSLACFSLVCLVSIVISLVVSCLPERTQEKRRRQCRAQHVRGGDARACSVRVKRALCARDLCARARVPGAGQRGGAQAW